MRPRNPQGRMCDTGRRIRRYGQMNQEIADKLAAPDPGLVQGTLDGM